MLKVFRHYEIFRDCGYPILNLYFTARYYITWKNEFYIFYLLLQNYFHSFPPALCTRSPKDVNCNWKNKKLKKTLIGQNIIKINFQINTFKMTNSIKRNKKYTVGKNIISAMKPPLYLNVSAILFGLLFWLPVIFSKSLGGRIYLLFIFSFQYLTKFLIY